MDITTIYPDGHIAKVNQRMTLIWTYRLVWQILHMNISIAMLSNHTQVKVSHVSEDFIEEIIAQEKNEKKVCIKCADGTKYYIHSSNVVRLEAGRNCTHIYLMDSELLIRKTLRDVINELQDGSILRIHQSYAVNVFQIESVLNYRANLKDGSVVPISRDHYAEMKKKINETMQIKNLKKRPME